jgi:hypothetical protein
MTGKPPTAVPSSRLIATASKVGSKTMSHAAMAIPTALVDQGRAIATATASQSASRTKKARSKRARLLRADIRQALDRV